MGGMKRLLTALQERCRHRWSEYEKDGWAHDSRYCLKCNKRETKRVGNAGYGL